MDEIESNILEAWRRIRPALLGDPDELARRLARRRLPLMTRPPRAWCIALRANDARINEATACIAPSHQPDSVTPPALSEVEGSSPHSVTVFSSTLLRLSRPVEIDQPWQQWDEVAAKLGVRHTGLTTARIKNALRVHYVPGLGGRRGRPVPLLGASRLLDPCARDTFAMPDRAWSWTGQYLIDRIPCDFEQTIKRIPVFRSHAPAHLYDENRHPEIDPVPPRRPSRQLPPPPPDLLAWYKWKGDEYIGYDWRAAECSPRVRINYERHQNSLARQRERRKARRLEEGPSPSQSMGSLHFRGYNWLCPACKKAVRVLYLPLWPVNLLAEHGGRIDHNDADAVQPPPETFACARCHNVRFGSRMRREEWNNIVAQLTGGLLYGHEVEKPAWFTPDRKRAYYPRPNTAAPKRQKVLRRLLNGWPLSKIARDLSMQLPAVHHQLAAICRQEGVRNRHGLARKLNSPHPQPLTPTEAAAQRRARLRELLRTKMSRQQIIRELATNGPVLSQDCRIIFESEGVKDRHAYCQKHGVLYEEAESPIRTEIRRRHATGQGWTQIAREMGRTIDSVGFHARKIRREQRANVPVSG